MSLQNSRQISDVKVLLKMGSDGSGIASIEKTGTSGIVDTYTITYDNGNKTTFTVTNGNGIVSIEKTATSRLVDTYTITFQDGTTTTFDVTNGRGIVSIEKTATQGIVDTYTITYNDNTTSTFTVTNGEGSTASSLPYDNATSGLSATNVQDAIDEVDGNVDTNATNITNLQNTKADQTSIAPVQTTLVASQPYPKGSQFYYNNILYEATADIANGGTITIGGNATTADDIVSQISNFANKIWHKSPTVSTPDFQSNVGSFTAKSLIFNNLNITPTEVAYVPTINQWVTQVVGTPTISGNSVIVGVSCCGFLASQFCKAGGYILYR